MTISSFRRAGLSESLESYAARHGMHPHEARPYWRAEGLLLLGVAPTPLTLARVSFTLRCQYVCAIAPGVAVLTRPLVLDASDAEPGDVYAPNIVFVIRATPPVYGVPS